RGAGYAGGSGACPRCKTPLKIPRPLAADSPNYVTGQRYLALPLTAAPADEIPTVVTDDMGPSRKFKCPDCGQLFESLPFEPHNPAQCPACSKTGTPLGQPTEFPRAKSDLQTKNSPPQQNVNESQIKPNDIVDGYLVLQPAESQEADTVIEGIAVDDNGNEINDQPAVENAQQKIPQDIPPQKTSKAQSDAKPQPEESQITSEKRISHPLSRSRTQTNALKTPPNIKNIPEGKWIYFIKGKVTGPLDTQSIRNMLAKGELSQSVLVWKSGMDNWLPADTFDELRIENQVAVPEKISFQDDSSTASAKTLNSRLQFLLWLAVILWAIVILTFLTRKTLKDIGIEAYTACVVVLLSFSAAGLGLGVMLIIKYGRSFLKSGIKSCIEWLSAMVAFICAIAISFSVYTHVDTTPVFENVEQYNKIAMDGFNSLYAGNFNDTLNRVNWETFVFNKRNVGQEFKSAATQKQKMLIIADVMDKLRKQVDTASVYGSRTLRTAQSQPAGSQPSTQPQKTAATDPQIPVLLIYSWTVTKQNADGTEVRGYCRNGCRINITIRGGMITEISIRQPEESKTE
ncbi:MAG TPA: GYF domain-containing protein, partial [Phycisphaerae bacterium]|nr:GYF domain-containing protein [Phycisphaerae bacterium]